MPLLLMLWCNVVKRNWIIILMQMVLCLTSCVLLSHLYSKIKAFS